MCIYAAAVLTASALIKCGASAGATITVIQTEASKEEAPKVRAAKRETTKTSEASERVGDTASEEIQAAVGKHHVKINVKDYGTISVELYGDEAPITMTNFLKLAKDDFYDGPTFHRIVSSFMIQGGDPLGTSMGGSDQEIKGRFSNNGMENPLPHTRGAISMMRSQMKDSTSSQFFIMYEDSTFPDGGYVCFRYATEGMEIMDAIYEDAKVEDSNDPVAKTNQPIIESIEVVD